MEKSINTFSTKDKTIMGNEQIFRNEEFGSVRTVQEGEKILFCGKDVAMALGYSDTKKALSQHCREDGVAFYPLIDSMGRTQEAKFIDEGNLYRLIVHSKLPSAEKFERWVFDEVLPSIRRHGIYATDDVIDNILNNPDFGIKLLTQLKEERVARIKAEKKNAILTHVNKTYTMTEIAKELNYKSAAELNKVLADKHIQYKVNGTWVLYSDYSNLGYEDIKQEVLDNGKVIYHRKITQMGREFILGLFGENER